MEITKTLLINAACLLIPPVVVVLLLRHFFPRKSVFRSNREVPGLHSGGLPF